MKWLRWLLPLGALVLLGCIVRWHNPAWWWIEVHTGTVNESGPYYGFFSGFGSDLSELALLGAVAAGYRKINCRQPRCLRIGHYPDSRGVKWCGMHHPDHKGRKPTVELLHRLHREHKERTG